MSAAWDSSSALSAVPWGERSREAFNCVPGDQQVQCLFGVRGKVGLLIMGSKAREARRTVARWRAANTLDLLGCSGENWSVMVPLVPLAARSRST